MGNQESIGILSTGFYLPDQVMTSRELATVSEIPQEIIEKKMGILQKPIPGPDDHTAQMGIWAAEQAIQRAGISATKLDLVIYIGEEHKEYPLWTAGIYTQAKLGAERAWSFDVALRCGTTVMALKLARALMLTDNSINTVLLAGGYRNVDFINYKNPRTRFMYNLAAGGGALILQKGRDEHQILESHIITDGSFSEDVAVPIGGTKEPLTQEMLAKGEYYLDVFDPEGMKERLEEKSLSTFVQVVQEAVRKSGYSVEEIDYLGILHMKRSAHKTILERLGLREDQAIYLEEYGHIGQLDQILSLELAVQEGRLKQGDLVVLVSAGIGYAWAATAIRW